MTRLEEFINETIQEHPDLKSEILELNQLCSDEIEAGESENHEIGLCLVDIIDLIENKKY